MSSSTKRVVPKPEWIEVFEAKLGGAISLHPNWLSLLKLVLITPLMFLSIRQVQWLSGGPTLVIGLFIGFSALDYLDGVVARARGLDSSFGRVLDRVTDYPLLLLVSYFCLDAVPLPALIAKLSLDALLMLLYVLGRGSTENRLRTTISYTTLITLLCVSQGWLAEFLSVAVVQSLLWVNIAFSSIVVLSNLGILRKRFIADALSGANLLCGILSMVFASRGRVEVSLLLLILGAAFDGFDGAAARRWGGTRFGVYSDDIADGVNYGIAPGVAIYYVLGGTTGLVIGISYSVFTISRLVYFTLIKSDDNGGVFAGVPSTVGGLVTLCSLILFAQEPALIGLMVGVACTLMVSFATHYQHLGRVAAKHRKALFGAPLYALLMVLGAKLFGVKVPVAIILVANLAYGFLPTLAAFVAAIRQRKLRSSQSDVVPPAEKQKPAR